MFFRNNAVAQVENFTFLFVDQKWKVSMIETHTGLVETAFTWAHEIGHAMNMQHDFLSYPSFEPRKDKDGKSCTKVSGIMDYSAQRPSLWTSCSKEDLTKLYNYEMDHFGKFCLDL